MLRNRLHLENHKSQRLKLNRKDEALITLGLDPERNVYDNMMALHPPGRQVVESVIIYIARICSEHQDTDSYLAI